MTQQYVVGQLSVLLGDLERSASQWQPAVRNLRREVESSPLGGLPRLAEEAIGLSDTICWAALEHGDVSRFRGCVNSACALGEFIDCAGLSGPCGSYWGG
jgi:hypothetical protein